jgi:hypothetical protein
VEGDEPLKLKRLIRRVLFFISACIIIISLFASRFPEYIESVYSTRFYTAVISPYSLFTGLFPFSLAELIVVLTVLLIVSLIVRLIIKLAKGHRPSIKGLISKSGNLLLAIIVIYAAFCLMWGFNYNRLTFAEIAGMDVKPATVDELADLCAYLTDKANELREHITEDENGRMTLSSGISDLIRRAHIGFEEASRRFPELGGRYGRPKAVLLSHFWSYTGVTGIYFPFTAEANVNIRVPQYLLPSSALHEMAHQRGFAREDEANYIAYLTASLHPDVEFQYSGTMLALNNAMNQLYIYSPDLRAEIRERFSDGINRDLSGHRDFINRYQGKVWDASDKMNNTYLVFHGQDEGLHSYGRMVDLLLAEFRHSLKK